jgi:prolyl-tRNA synthetase
MTKKEKRVEQITSRDVDFSQWYTDIVVKAELISYSPVRGCMILRPYGFAIWERLQAEFDRMLKASGHENVAMPLFIPESLLQKEKDHVEGFAPEVAWVTQGGDEVLSERLVIRPTSETLFCAHYAETIESWRDLPKLYNQWCSVVRWEKSTRPFLRTTEFFWQEGHTAHADEAEAREETLRILNMYEDLYRDVMAIPVIKGRKSDKEKFAGARETYTVEAMMHDGKALQAATSHYFGDGFAKAFDITFTDRNNELKYVHQTSWGISTRSIGGLIMVHGDDDGLRLPPRIAPVQIVIVPVAMHKPGVLDAAHALKESLSDYRVKIDDTDKMPGWKFAEHEMKGVPLRLEIGPRDIENNACLAVRRDTGEKQVLPLDNIAEAAGRLLEAIHSSMLSEATELLNKSQYEAADWVTFTDLIAGKPGFVHAYWCGSEDCEAKVKDETQATSRCLVETDKLDGRTCVVCGEPAKHLVIWGKAY